MAKYTGVRATGGGIQIRYQVRGRSYSQWIAKPPTESNLADAARLRRRLIEDAKLGLTQTRMTFEAACVAALKDLSRRRKPATVLAYRRRLEAHWSDLASLDIADIQRADILRVDGEQVWRSQKTRADNLNAMSAVIRWAIDQGLRHDNPARGLDIIRHQAPEPEPFTDAEMAAILDHLPGQARALFGLMSQTGCRTGELRALRWEDVEPDAIRISGTMWDGQKAPTKNMKTRRVLLTLEAKRILREHTASRFAGGWVFAEQGAPLDHYRLARLFRRACQAAGVRYRRPYTLRHTYASRALTAGVELGWLAEQMGDEVTTVARHYARWIGGERDQRELAKLEMNWQAAPSGDRK